MNELPTNGETVLIVEDEDIVRRVLHSMLTKNGYRVLAARNGQDALDLSKTHEKEKIDLVITDLSMPHMSGTELAKKLALERPGIPIIYISGNTRDMAAQNEGIIESAHFIEKSDLLNVLPSKVRQILNS